MNANKNDQGLSIKQNIKKTNNSSSLFGYYQALIIKYKYNDWRLSFVNIYIYIGKVVQWRITKLVFIKD